MTRVSELGFRVSGKVQDVLQQAGLNYTTGITPVLYDCGTKSVVALPRHFVMYRTDTGSPFGVVKSRYEIVQNAVAFNFLDKQGATNDRFNGFPASRIR